MQANPKKYNQFSKPMVCLLSFLIVLQIINKSVYTHTHIMANGQVISHAHPYNKTTDSKPFKSHHHTRTEFVFYKNLGMLFPLVFLLLLVINNHYKLRLFLPDTDNLKPAWSTIRNNRAPPLS
jgi:hypothetical protein